MSKPVSSCFLRPYYERDHLCHWEVLLNPVQIRPGHIQSDDIAIFNQEPQARDFVDRLKAQNPDLAELAVVPSNCPHGPTERASQ